MQIIDTTAIDETIAELEIELEGELEGELELVVASGPLSIDMLTPVETCLELGLGETQVVDLVNSGRLAAYRLGGHLRFRATDVACLATVLRRRCVPHGGIDHLQQAHHPAA